MNIKTLILTALATIGMTIATLAQNVPSYVPANGLVGWWPFNGNANDESGNGNNGSIQGPTFCANRFGINNSSIFFQSADSTSKIDFGVLSYPNQFSISIWQKRFNYQNTFNVLLSCYDGQNGFELKNTGTAVDLVLGDGKKWGSIIDPDTLPLYQWIHIVATFNGQNAKLFINGIQKLNCTIINDGNISSNTIIANELNFPLFSTNTNYSLLLGDRTTVNATEQFNFEGELDDLGFWNRELSKQEITDLYNSCQLLVNAQPINDTIYINNNTQFIVGAADTSATYQWQTDLGFGFQNLNSGGQYSGTANDTLTVSNVNMNNNNQPFRCVVTSGSCSDTSAFALLAVNNNVGMNDLSQDNLFSVFPNPAQRVINVKADIGLIGSLYMVYNHIGKALLTGKLSAEITNIDLGNLPAGIYLVKVGKNITKTFKVTKE